MRQCGETVNISMDNKDGAICALDFTLKKDVQNQEAFVVERSKKGLRDSKVSIAPSTTEKSNCSLEGLSTQNMVGDLRG